MTNLRGVIWTFSFWLFKLIKYPCSDETEDEDANEEYIEDTNRDAVMIAAAKLVLADTVSKVCAAFSSCDKVLKLCTSNYSCGN